MFRTRTVRLVAQSAQERKENDLIGLREGLQAALVVGILVAHLVRTGNRHRLPPVWPGVLTAVALSIGVGAMLTYTSATLTGPDQETFAGVTSLVAICFVTWMIFWMRPYVAVPEPGAAGQARPGAHELGYLLYKRSVRLNLATLFKVTGAGLVVVAAGVPSYGVHDLQEGGVLPGLNSLAFDVTAQVPLSS